MKPQAHKANLEAIQPYRHLFLQEINRQVRYDACHERGWSDSYLLTLDGREVGYASIKGEEIAGRETVFEFYLIPAFRKHANPVFRELVAVSGAHTIECQSNDCQLSSLLYEFSQAIRAEAVLFEDHSVTEHSLPGVVFRLRQEGESIFAHQVEPVGEYVLERSGEVVATGGYALHYNMPFADLYMEVKEDCRGQGLGSFLVQELKRACYLAGRVPAARCPIENRASRATLCKAGLRVSGFMLKGRLKEVT